MNQYLIDTQYASKTLIETIYSEELKLEGLVKEVASLRKKHEVLHLDFSTADMHEDVNDKQLQDKFIKMAKNKQELNKLTSQIDLLNNSISYKIISIDSLSMSLLQVAKQGISTVHGTLLACPNGKNVGRETLKNVIWQGRNQAIHCEEGNPHPPVRQCFANLAIDFGADFDITANLTSNKSKKIVDLLNWKKCESYEADMISLLG